MELEQQVTVAQETKAELDAAVAELSAQKQEWARLSVAQKRAFIQPMRVRTHDLAEDWAMAGARAKRLAPDSQMVGEEWMSGPWGVLYALNSLDRTLEALETGKLPPMGRLHERPNGQLVAKTYPQDLYDRLLLSGYSAETWMQPDVSREEFPDTLAVHHRSESPEGAVALVLGAGNLSSIAPLDVLFKLLVEGQVVILKTHPVTDYLRPFLEKVFGEFIERGFVRIVPGGVEVGTYLATHPEVDEIHLTGSWKTYDAIVFGTGPEGAERKRRGEIHNLRRVTAELGCVTPTIVLPGPWSEADIRYQAEHIATQKSFNGGFNCVAAQVLVMPSQWEAAPRLIQAVRQAYDRLEPRHAYYPGATDRLRSAAEGHEHIDRLGKDRVLIRNLDPEQVNETCFRDEIFADLLAVTDLPGDTPRDYLRKAVQFCNEVLWGTLGASIIVHPRTARSLGPALEEAIAELRYGTVGINVWVSAAYLIPQGTWGAYPGHVATDIQSGVGVVHNSLMFDRPEKTVVRGPFYPFPRNLMHGEYHLSPKPPWFVTHRRAAELGRRLVEFEAKRGLRHLPGIFLSALRG